MVPDEPQPTLTRTRSGAGWRVPAIAVGVALVALVALTRLGGSDRPTATAAPSALAAVPTAASEATAQPQISTLTVNRLGGVMRRSPDGLTYVDGIPTGISGQSVYRVRDALLTPLGHTVLVGGWYLDRRYLLRECAARLGQECSSPTYSDVPLVGSRDVATAFVALDANLAGTGAYIVLATLEADPRCSIRAVGECQPRLHVLQTIWTAAV